jgi:uncharacterized protein (TIGR02246 family)
MMPIRIAVRRLYKSSKPIHLSLLDEPSMLFCSGAARHPKLRIPRMKDLTMKKIYFPLPAFFAFLLIISGCSQHEETLPPNVITSLRTTCNAGDATAAAELFTEDGAMLPRFGAPVKGKAAMKKFMEKTLRRQLQFWINSETSTVSGDLAYDEGTYRIRDIRRNEDLDAGKYINIFKRVNGEWKIYRSIFSASGAPDASSN